MRGSCHHCLAIVQKGTAVVCSSCKVVGYCSKECLNAASPLHSMECKGIAELEQLRNKVPVATEIDGRSYWPPLYVLMIARAINKRILQGEDYHNDNWIRYLARHDLPPGKVAAYDTLIKPFVHCLVPTHVTDHEIYQMYRAIIINAADVICPPGTAAAAFYFEYSLLNHMCRPNSDFENNSGAVSVYALQDIEPGSQLGISYLHTRYCVNVREVRRKELKDLFGFDCCCFVCLGEEVVGSEHWLLDQQKRSLIAPWSRKMADDIMEMGWQSICQSESMKRVQSIQLLESAIEIQKSVLDKSNITLILTAWYLLREYSLLPDYKKGINHLKSLGEVGMNAFFQYGTMKEVDGICKIIARCCSELGLTEKARELSDLMLNFFPKVPSGDALRSAMLAKGVRLPSSMIKLLQEKVTKREVIHTRQVISHILELCDDISKM